MRGGVYPRLTNEIMRDHAHPFRGAQVPSFFVLKLADKNRLDGMHAEAALVRVAIEHLRKCGAQKVKFSIMGVASDVMSYVNLYQSLGFEIWRRAQSMRRSLENIPECKTRLPLTMAMARYIGVNAFVNLFIQCFKDSSDRDASLIASNIEKTKKFIQELREREDQYYDPDGWIAASIQDEFVGFAIAIREEHGEGLIAEVGIIPQFRRRGIGTFPHI